MKGRGWTVAALLSAAGALSVVGGCSDDAADEPSEGANDDGGSEAAEGGNGGDGGVPLGSGTTVLSAGWGFACGLGKGRIKCWGTNDVGQLGVGDVASRGASAAEMGASLPQVELGGAPIAVSAGLKHACALLDDGSVKCWGNNAAGRLGVGDETNRGDGPGQMGDALPAVSLGTGRTAKAVTAGGNHTCALLDDGTIKCWGGNVAGQLGRGDVSSRGTSATQMGDALPAVDLGAGRVGRDVVAGRYHTCALLDEGTVECWGYNYEGELGLGDTDNRGDAPGEMGAALAAVDLGAGRSARAIVAGAFHTCALLDDEALKCWGRGSDGQLGLGATAPRGVAPGEMGDALPAIDLGAGRKAVAVAAGERHTCAVLDDGSVRCWGANDFGQLGTGSPASRGVAPGEMGDALPPVDLGAGRTAKRIAAGVDHTCAWLDDDTIKCWGRDDTGQLGVPLREPNAWLGAGRTAKSIAAGARHTCAVLDDGTVKCWGGNPNGELGLGDVDNRGDAVGEMTALATTSLGTGRTAVTISAGALGNHTCAVLDDLSVKCWGYNNNGQLGLGDALARGDAPNEMGDDLPAADMGTGHTVKATSSGGYHSCARLDDDSVKCWARTSTASSGSGSATALREATWPTRWATTSPRSTSERDARRRRSRRAAT